MREGTEDAGRVLVVTASVALIITQVEIAQNNWDAPKALLGLLQGKPGV